MSNELPLHAELSGDKSCSSAGITATGHAPVLALCRQLLAAGLDPDQALEVYRGAILCLKVRSIGEAARLEVNPEGTGFAPFRASRTAPPMRPNEVPRIRVPAAGRRTTEAVRKPPRRRPDPGERRICKQRAAS